MDLLVKLIELKIFPFNEPTKAFFSCHYQM